MPNDKLPDGWSVHTRDEFFRDQALGTPNVDEDVPLRQREGFRFEDMAFDLTPDPVAIAPREYRVTDYVDTANGLDPYSHRIEGEIAVTEKDARWILNHLRAAGFRLVRPTSEPSRDVLKEAFALCDVVDLPPVGTVRGLVQICAHEVIELSDGSIKFVPWQLKIEPKVHPNERRWSYEENPDEPVYKGRNMIRDSRRLGDFLLVAGEDLNR